MYYAVLLILVVALSGPAFGQRIVRTIDVADFDENLRFDSNDVPFTGQGGAQDLNFSPNMVFAPESGRGFVSFPSSDRVGVFDPDTGEILDAVQVGNNPVLLTLTPDGKKVAAVCLFLKENVPNPDAGFEGQQVGAIAMIDTETLEVEILSLEKVFFSFANNVVFSDDGSTGFVASAGTDEILRFDVATLTEVGPRLAMASGTRPSSITMASDHSFFTAVLVGSTFLDRRLVPDSVKVIDTDSFTITRSIAPEVPVGVGAHNFFPTNTVALSPDGKLGLIADRRNSRAVPTPALASDRAFLFDVETGEILDVFTAGNGTAHGAYLAPDGKTFIVLSDFDVTLIDYEARTSQRISPFNSNFSPTSRLAFSADGDRLFVASPLDDRLLTIDLRTREILSSVLVGELVEIGENQFLPAAPHDLALVPGGELLAILHFNSNQIDFVRETQRLVVPRILSNDEWFTGVAFTNTSDFDSEVIATGFRVSGARFDDDPETEDVVEFVNPRNLDLPSGTQKAMTVAELMQAATPDQEMEGWVHLDVDQPEIDGFFLIGDLDQRRLDGGLAVQRTGTRHVFPIIRVDDGFTTQLSLVNPGLNQVNATVTLYSSEGEVLGRVSDQTVPPRVLLNRFVRSPDPEQEGQGMFPESTFEEFEAGYLVISSSNAFTAFLRYWDEERMAALNAVRIGGLDVEPATTLYIPQVALFSGSDTYLSLAFPFELEQEEEGEDGENGESEEQEEPRNTIRLTLRDNQGQEMASSVTVELGSFELLHAHLAELFGVADPGHPVAGWIEIESEIPGIAAAAEIRTFSGRAMTTIPGQVRPATSLVFSHVAQGLGYSTGLALLNPNQESALIEMYIFTPEGDLSASTSFALAPGARRSELLSEFIPGFTGQVGGFIRIFSNVGVFGLELFFTNDLEQLSAVPGQVLQTAQ